jgi:hypothetical protein
MRLERIVQIPKITNYRPNKTQPVEVSKKFPVIMDLARLNCRTMRHSCIGKDSITDLIDVNSASTGSGDPAEFGNPGTIRAFASAAFFANRFQRARDIVAAAGDSGSR